MEFVTKVACETKNLGRKIGASLNGGEILALTGDLGSGKTTFIQGLAEGLGIKVRIISPTFILMRKYDISPVTSYQSPVTCFYHLDLYRLEENVEQEMKNIGVGDLWGREENIFAIEWAEKIKSILPKNTTRIKFESLVGDKRKIKISS